MSGGFEMESLPVFHEGIPKNFEYQLLPENWDHFGKCILMYYQFVYSVLISEMSGVRRQKTKDFKKRKALACWGL